ncbi:ABC transporter substrate-binding protein [Chloroflexota bacterium]
MRSRRKLILLVNAALVVVLVLAMSAVACSDGDDQVVKKEVKVGFGAAFLGAGAASTNPGSQGTIDYMRFVNDEGGIDGVKLNVLWRECSATAGKYIPAFAALADEGIIGHVNYGGLTELAPRVQKEEIPALLWGKMSAQAFNYPTQWAFTQSAGYAPEFARIMKWVVEDYWTEARPCKVGFIGAMLESSYSSLENAERDASQLGLEWVGSEMVPLVGLIDCSTELYRLKDKGADVILTCGLGAAMVVMVEDYARLDFMGEGIQPLQIMGVLDQGVISVVGDSADGWLVYMEWPTPDFADPNYANIFQAGQEYHGWSKTDVSQTYIAGWVTQMSFVEAIRIALDEVGFENLNRSALRDAIFSITNYDTGILPPMTITEDRPFVNPGGYIKEVQEGELVTKSEFLKPYYYIERTQ